MIKKHLFTYTLFAILTLSMGNSYALSPLQAQEIRFSRAKVYLAQEQKKKAMKLFKEILDGPFHLDTEIFLARYFFEQKSFTKSFRLYQHILKKIYHERIVGHPFVHPRTEAFREYVSRYTDPTKQTLAVVFELAEKYFEAFTFKYLPEEFQMSILNLSEKYFNIADLYNLHDATTKFYLSKIYLIRGDNPLAVKTLRETQKAFDKDKFAAQQLGLKDEDIKVHLAEALAKQGFNDSSLLVLLNLQKRKDLSSSTRHYVSNFMNQFEKSFLRSTFSYQLKNKKNINQLGQDDYNNFENLSNKDDLGAKDSFVHWNRFHLYYHRRLADDRDLGINGTLLVEKPLSGAVENPKNEQFSLDVNYKMHSTKNRFWSFAYQVYLLSGRKLSTLENFQAKVKHILTPSHIWINERAKWILSAPFEMRKTQTQRTATSLGAYLAYQPYFKVSWLNPTLSGMLARRTEGESFDSSMIIQAGLENSYPINPKLNWVLALDYYLNSNSAEALNYSEISMTNLFSYPLENLKGFQIESDIQYRTRTNDLVGNINTLDLGIGFTYTF